MNLDEDKVPLWSLSKGWGPLDPVMSHTRYSKVVSSADSLRRACVLRNDIQTKDNCSHQEIGVVRAALRADDCINNYPILIWHLTEVEVLPTGAQHVGTLTSEGHWFTDYRKYNRLKLRYRITHEEAIAKLLTDFKHSHHFGYVTTNSFAPMDTTAQSDNFAQSDKQSPTTDGPKPSECKSSLPEVLQRIAQFGVHADTFYVKPHDNRHACAKQELYQHGSTQTQLHCHDKVDGHSKHRVHQPLQLGECTVANNKPKGYYSAARSTDPKIYTYVDMLRRHAIDSSIHGMVVNAAPAPPLSDNDARCDVFDIVSEWIMDTGCGHDLIAKTHALAHKRDLRQWNKITFQTANGNIARNTILPAKVGAFGGQESNAYILNETPSVLSVGLRCMEYGFWLLWL